MVLKFFMLAVAYFFISCTDIARDNPNDPGSPNYVSDQLSSSSSVALVVPSSSSEVVATLSSSSSKPSSSSSVASSVASSVPSSSSKPNSSSSVAPVVPSSSSVPTQTGTIKGDPVSYEGETYETVKIGEQIWLAMNLNYAVEGSKCYSNNEPNCATYGRLYDWATAMALSDSCNSSTCASQVNAKHRGICPSGWHIPSDAEWTTLINFVGSSTAVTKLKATSGWNSNGNGSDTYGFSALPGGVGNSEGFYYVGDYGGWWSSSEYDSGTAYYKYIREHLGYPNDSKSYLFSVRCVQD